MGLDRALEKTGFLVWSGRPERNPCPTATGPNPLEDTGIPE